MGPRPASTRPPSLVVLSFVLLATLLATVSACARAGGGPIVSSPPPQPAASATRTGADLLQSGCTLCHDLGGLGAFAGSFGEPEWRALVERMVVYGAPLNPPEVETLSAYLAVNFGTAGPEATPEAADTSSELAALVESACTGCHDLSALTSNPAGYTESALRETVMRMMGYGAPVSPEQVEPLVGYLATAYGR